MKDEGYPRGSRHCVILAGPVPVFECQDEYNAKWAFLMMTYAYPQDQLTLVLGAPYLGEGRAFQ